MLDNHQVDRHFPVLLLLHTLYLYLHSRIAGRIYLRLLRMQMPSPVNSTQLRKVQPQNRGLTP